MGYKKGAVCIKTHSPRDAFTHEPGSFDTRPRQLLHTPPSALRAATPSNLEGEPAGAVCCYLAAPVTIWLLQLLSGCSPKLGELAAHLGLTEECVEELFDTRPWQLKHTPSPLRGTPPNLGGELLPPANSISLLAPAVTILLLLLLSG